MDIEDKVENSKMEDMVASALEELKNTENPILISVRDKLSKAEQEDSAELEVPEWAPKGPMPINDMSEERVSEELETILSNFQNKNMRNMYRLVNLVQQTNEESNMMWTVFSRFKRQLDRKHKNTLLGILRAYATKYIIG